MTGQSVGRGAPCIFSFAFVNIQLIALLGHLTPGPIQKKLCSQMLAVPGMAEAVDSITSYSQLRMKFPLNFITLCSNSLIYLQSDIAIKQVDDN